MPLLHVVAPGVLSTVQDSRGRTGYGRYGVAHGGALDPMAAAAANCVVGNAWDAALLELTVIGPTLRVEGGSIAMGIAGADLDARIDGHHVRPGWSWLARSGAVLEFSEQPPAVGARAWLAVSGGLDVPTVLGSPSTDLRAAFGGLSGRALKAGDRLAIRAAADVVGRCGGFLAAAAVVPEAAAPVRVVAGPHVERFRPGSLERLCTSEWHIADGADRMGYRLVGQPLAHVAGPDVASVGLPLGAIQVPGDGQPIVLLADHQPTGGYTVVACVIRADLGVLAQRRPGDTLTFRQVTVADARAALAAQHAALVRPRDSGLEAWT